MPSREEIIDALQFAFLNSKDPINDTTDPVYTITYQYAGTSEPTDWEFSSTYSGWTEFTAAEKTAIRDMMDHIETLINVEFVEDTSTSDPDLNLGKVTLAGSTAGVGGYSASSSGSTITRYDAYAVFDNTIDISSGDDDLIVHELGHALGLKHPFDAPALPTDVDTQKWTVMSYTENPDNGVDSTAMQAYDILALQDLWGQNDDTASGDDTYTGSRTSTIDSVWDSGGIDTFDGSAVGSGVTIDLREGKFSNFSGIDDVSIAYDTVIENAIGGGGKDKLTGNSTDNTVEGGGGRDKIYGNGGLDKLLGQGGVDRIWGGNGADIIKGGGGKDTIYGEKGKDKLWGDGKADTFVFEDDGGYDIIKDFENDLDVLMIDHADFSSEAEFLALGKDKGGNAVFNLTDGKIKVIGISVSDLSDDVDVV